MKRVMLDTNIYEFILREFDTNALRSLENQREIITPKEKIVKKHRLAVTPKIMFLEKLRTPDFIRFENFLKEIRRYVS